MVKTAVVLEVTRPALRLLRKLPKFGEKLDETYRAHGFGRVLEDLSLISDKPVGQALADELRRSARYMVYGKNHVLCQEGQPIDRLILIKSGWVRRIAWCSVSCDVAGSRDGNRREYRRRFSRCR